MVAKTIFALSSGQGPAGIAVFRVSGPHTCKAIEQVTRRAVPLARKAVLRSFYDHAPTPFDNGLLLFFAGPSSFTGEDLAEFHVHGGLASIRAMAAALGAVEGVGPALAGAFTERAFLNGKLDLVQVEALGDLLAAETVEQARFSQRAVEGLRQAADHWRDQLLTMMALTEASIDFSEEDDISRSLDSGAEQAAQILHDALADAIDGFERGERLRRGLRVALCGAPNAGKSSLINALARRDVSIVSPIAGTTRDVIEVHLDLDGMPVILIDTAGIRATEDEIERIGVDRARAAAAAADVVLWLSPCDEPTDCVLPGAVVVRTKADLIDSYPKQPDGIMVSVAGTDGLRGLLEWLAGQARRLIGGDFEGVIVARERQRTELLEALAAVGRFMALGSDQCDCRAEEARRALLHLDRLIGRIDSEEVLGAIFSRFCIGK